jgi:hypothetical protein
MNVDAHRLPRRDRVPRGDGDDDRIVLIDHLTLPL